MTDPQRDPIAAAVEGVCGEFCCSWHSSATAGRLCSLSCRCECGPDWAHHPQWRHWLRDAREQLAEIERENVRLREVLEKSRTVLFSTEGRFIRHYVRVAGALEIIDAALAHLQPATTETSDGKPT